MMRRLSLTLAIAGVLSSGFVMADAVARQPLYYQDPDGKPFYSATPHKAPDGHAYTAIFTDPAAQSDATRVNLAAKPAAADHRVLYYRNPMGLPDTSPVPKKDSMGMDYLPVYADDASQNDPPGTVRVSAGRIQTLGVTSEPVTLISAAGRTVRATGALQFDERGLATVTTRVSGWIDHLVVAATGDPVRRGQVLAMIYSPDAVASEKEYLVASNVGYAIGEASEQRLNALGVPDDEIERLQRTHHVSHTIAVLAPEDGVVIDKPVQEGMRINAGDPLYRTADLSDIWLIAQVQEQDLGEIKPGDRASASFVAFPGRTFEGRVDFIYPTLAPETRTGRVRIVLPNPDGLLREQMYATVAIDAASHGQPALMVPESAVLDNGTKQVVLLDLGKGRFEPRSVRLGFRNDGAVQVLSGLKAGDRVVTGANFLIDAESNLRAALRGFASGDQSQSTQSGAN
jgi:membrane fusion protein, copper/silver efflux system